MKVRDDRKCDMFVSLRDLYWRYSDVLYEGFRGHQVWMPHDHSILFLLCYILGLLWAGNYKLIYLVTLALAIFALRLTPRISGNHKIMVDRKYKGSVDSVGFMMLFMILEGYITRPALEKGQLLCIFTMIAVVEILMCNKCEGLAPLFISSDYASILRGCKTMSKSWSQTIFNARTGVCDSRKVWVEQFNNRQTNMGRYNDFKLVRLFNLKFVNGALTAGALSEYTGEKEVSQISDSILCLINKVMQQGRENYWQGTPDSIVVYGVAHGSELCGHWGYLIKYSFVSSRDQSIDWSYGLLVLGKAPEPGRLGRPPKTFCNDFISSFHIVRSAKNNKRLDELLRSGDGVISWPDVPICR